MKRINLFELFDLLSNESFGSFNTEPKNDDKNWTKTTEEFEKDGFITIKETWTSIDGTSKYVKTHTESKMKRMEDVKLLESQLKISIDNEEYEVAAQLRDKIKELKK